MPIGVVSDDAFFKELDSYKNPSVSKPVEVITPEIVDLPTKGRSEGDVNIPDSLRKIIGETAVIDGRKEALQIAEMFGISDSSVSAYAKGATSTTSYNEPSKSIISHINKSRQRSIKKAQNKLNGALEALTQEKLDYADAKDLSTIAKDMSVIIKNLEPDKVTNEGESKIQPQFVIFAPQFRDERSFDTINVAE